jgi:hypothetical protein
MQIALSTKDIASRAALRRFASEMFALDPRAAAADERESPWFCAKAQTVGPEYAATLTARSLNTRAATIYGGSGEV